MHAPYKTVYLISEAGAYIGQVTAYLDELASANKEAVYIAPPNSVDQQPPEPAPDHKAWFWCNQEWLLLPDFSHSEVWRISDGSPAQPPLPGQDLPTDLTVLCPPEPGIRQVRRWNAGLLNWEIVTDHRGETWYSTATGQAVPIETVDLPSGVTDSPPPTPHHVWKFGKWVLLAEAKTALLHEQREAAIAKISAWRDDQENGSIIFEHGGRRWDGGKAVRERFQPAISAMKTVDIPGFIWTSADNEDVPMTLKELESLAAAHDVAMVMQGNKIHVRQRAMKEAVAQMREKQLAAFVPGWGD